MIVLRTKVAKRCGYTSSGFPRIKEQGHTIEGHMFHCGECTRHTHLPRSRPCDSLAALRGRVSVCAGVLLPRSQDGEL